MTGNYQLPEDSNIVFPEGTLVDVIQTNGRKGDIQWALRNAQYLNLDQQKGKAFPVVLEVSRDTEYDERRVHITIRLPDGNYNLRTRNGVSDDVLRRERDLRTFNIANSNHSEYTFRNKDVHVHIPHGCIRG